MIDNKKVAGIICEYNPFHNGHKFQIEQTRKNTDCQYVVCAMSGSMVQRGDVAIYDKWVRSHTAIEGGADLVIELPTYYVLQSANHFARGGVELLSRLGVVDVLSFGSECADLDKLKTIAQILSDEPEEFRLYLQNALAEGKGYPQALQSALKSTVGKSLEPNDTLAVNYIAALKNLGSSIEPYAIKRNVPYHGEKIADNNITSATAIRKMIEKEENISAFIPQLQKCATYDMHRLENLILGFFRLCSSDSLKNIIGMEEGLENRLISCAKKACSLDEFVESVVSKRYTAHRVRRVILSSLLGMSGERRLDYVRVLAFNEKGREILSKIKQRSDLNIITKTADSKVGADSMFEFDILATDIAALCSSDCNLKQAGRDFFTSALYKNNF